MGIRKDLVMKVLAKELPVVELCREYGVSRKTEYKWLKRFREQGMQGLVDESRRPDSTPLETTAEMTLAVLDARKAHPTWGPKKLRRLLQRRFSDGVPSERTIARVLSRSQMTRKRKPRPSHFRVSTTYAFVVSRKPAASGRTMKSASRSSGWRRVSGTRRLEGGSRKRPSSWMTEKPAASSASTSRYSVRRGQSWRAARGAGQPITNLMELDAAPMVTVS